MSALHSESFCEEAKIEDCSFIYLFIIIICQDLYVLYYVAEQLLHEVSLVSHVIFVIFQV